MSRDDRGEWQRGVAFFVAHWRTMPPTHPPNPPSSPLPSPPRRRRPPALHVPDALPGDALRRDTPSSGGGSTAAARARVAADRSDAAAALAAAVRAGGVDAAVALAALSGAAAARTPPPRPSRGDDGVADALLARWADGAAAALGR